MLKKILLLLCVLLLAVTSVSCKEKPQEGDNMTPTPTVPTKPAIPDYNGSYVQVSDYRDYTFMWMDDSWRSTKNKNACIQTGYYGLYIDTIYGQITNMGAIENPVTETEAFKQDSTVIKSLPEATMKYTATIDGVEYFSNVGVVAPAGRSTTIRVLESGHYLQSMDLMYLSYLKNTDLKGRLEIKALPSQFALHYSLYSEKQVSGVGLSFSITLDPRYTKHEFSSDGRAITISSDKGDGFTFVMPSYGNMKIEYQDNTVKFMASDLTLEANAFSGFGVVCIPSMAASLEDAQKQTAIQNMEATAVEIAPRDGRERNVTFDADRGIWVVDIANMHRFTGQDFASERNRNRYDRLVFTFKNNSDKTVKVPVMFENAKDLGYGRGMTPLLRDANTQEPIGHAIQLNRNWHEYDPNPENYLSGYWVHAYTLIEVPAHREVSYEFSMAYMQWGTVNAVSHTQLCLAGWIGSNNFQFWDTSSVGNPGESFCYDLDGCCGFGHICDSNAMGVKSDNGQEYVGIYGSNGGNFLYYQNKHKEVMYLTQVKTHYKWHGPNLTDIYYSGITKDGAVKVEINVSMGRTDDAARALQTFKYTFLKDTTFARLAFYMMGYDTYNAGGWETMTIGNNDGPISFNMNGKQYGADFPIDTSQPVDYVGGQGMQRIDVPGEGFWAVYTGATGKPFSKNEYMQFPQCTNRMLALRSYSSTINGKKYNQPAFNLRVSQTTFAPDCKSYVIELCPPSEVGDTIQAGSVVEGSVEYLNLPYKKANYYMNSNVIKNIPAEYFNNYQLAYYYYQRMNYETVATVGKVLQQLPIKVLADESAGGVVAEITVKGGLSYVPITFTGLSHFAGYRLEYNNNGTWETVDQSVHGNDFWQCNYNAETASFELTFNVEHAKEEIGAQYSYRLVKG